MRPTFVLPMPLLLVVLLLGSSSGQLLFSLQRPVFKLPVALIGTAGNDDASKSTLDYKEQVEQRNLNCYIQCSDEFPKAEGSLRACERGCRLFAIAEATTSDRPTNEHRDKCVKDCETAYPVPVEQHSCQSGCRLQHPKQQMTDGAPVVMSVVRKFSFDSENGQEVRRAESSLLVHDGDKVRLIQGPAQVTVTRHDESSPLELASAPGGGMFPQALDEMMARMRQKVSRMMSRLGGIEPEQEPERREPAQHEPERQEPERMMVRIQSPVDSMEIPVLRSQHTWASGGWRCLWSGAPHYITLAVLLLGTTLVLYTVYCLICLARRRRRRRQQLLLQDEQQTAVAEDLPPKYSLATDEAELSKAAEAGELPPTYTAIAADGELPPKLDV